MQELPFDTPGEGLRTLRELEWQMKKRNPDIVAMTWDRRIVRGKRTSEWCIRVYVTTKRPTRSIHPSRRIPRTINGLRTDVVEIGIIGGVLSQAKLVLGGAELVKLRPFGRFAFDAHGCPESPGINWETQRKAFTAALVTDAQLLEQVRLIARSYGRHPLSIPEAHKGSTVSGGGGEGALEEDVCGAVVKICKHFKQLIEQNGLWRLLFDDDGKVRGEWASQLVFLGIADLYCLTKDLDISREPETGRGPVDFKVSKGCRQRVLVEIKLSSNPKALDGLTAQLPTYLQAQNATHGVFVLIKVGQHEEKLRRIIETHRKLKSEGKQIPELFIVDATAKRSASKLKGIYKYGVAAS